MEYMWTSEEIIKTGISIDTVNESKLKLHNMSKDSESIHLNSFIETGALFIPTSKKDTIDKTAVVTTRVHVIRWEPVTPIFLPKNPETIDPSKGNIIIVKYIT